VCVYVWGVCVWGVCVCVVCVCVWCGVCVCLFMHIYKGVKCTLVQALRPCTGLTAHSGSRGMALLFLDHGTRRVKPRPLFTPGKDPVLIVQ